MPEEVNSEFEIIAGSGNIILAAPHSGPGDDENTGRLTRLLAERLNCHAIINRLYRKTNWIEINGRQLKESIDLYCNEVDLNSVVQIEQAGLKKKWLAPLETLRDDILKENGCCLIFILLEARDTDIKKVSESADILLGSGRVQPDSAEAARATADDAVVDQLTRLLREKGSLTAVEARFGNTDHDALETRYAGYSKDDLNQYLAAPAAGMPSKTVHAIQLVIAERTIRNSPAPIAITDSVSQAMSGLDEAAVQLPEKKEAVAAAGILSPAVENQPDDDLVAAAYSELKNIFVKRYEEARNRAMLDAGNYIIATFYDQNYQLAKNKNQAIKKKSLHRLIKKLQEQSGDTPSKTWIYDAVALAVDEHELESFRTYGKISVSHKLKLLKVRDLETKKQLIAETVSQPLSVRQLALRIKEETGREPELADLIRKPDKLFSGKYAQWYSEQSLTALEPKKRAAIKDRINRYTAKIQDKISKQQQYLEQYKKILGRLEKG